MSYLMESAEETRRLLAQEQVDPVRARLIAAGLVPGSRVLDAGCGPGAVSELIADLVGPTGSVLGIDSSADRIGEATRRTKQRVGVEFSCADILATGLPADAFDFTWSQFVFEYLRDPGRALRELIRVTRSGGKVVVSEIDGSGLANWPFPPEMDSGLHKVIDAIAKTGFDLFCGRKLYQLFRRAGLNEVKVRLGPLYVVAGAADEQLMEDWRIRFQTLEPVAAPEFGSVELYRAFCDTYLRMLSDDEGLKYAVVLVTEGTKP